MSARTVFIGTAAASCTLPLVGCGPQQGAAQATPQGKLCVFSDNAAAAKCKDGELAYFSPDSWGNEQLPLGVIALYCNTNAQVLFNKSGVVCTFTDKRLWMLKPAQGGSAPAR